MQGRTVWVKIRARRIDVDAGAYQSAQCLSLAVQSREHERELLLRRACLPSEHLMDERFPIYFNDVALARWLADRGNELWMTPDAAVYHDHGASTRLMGSALTRQYLGAQVRYLLSTEPAYRVALFRVVIGGEYLARAVVRHPGAMPIRDLLAALDGDPGSLPRAQRRTE